MMATVPHVTFGSGLRKFQADGFLLDRVYKDWIINRHLVQSERKNLSDFKRNNDAHF